jgi:sugar lactone lactonase YvrE
MIPNPGLDAKVWRVAGAYGGLSGAPTRIQLLQPTDVFADASGNVLVADQDASVVRRVNSDATFSSVFAGTGKPAGFGTGDSGPATEATVKNPSALAQMSDGSILISDRGDNRIRKVSPDGAISTFAGNYKVGFQNLTGVDPEGRPATEEPLNAPNDVSTPPDGSVLIADQINARVRRVTTDGKIFTVAGTGTHGNGGDGAAAMSAELDQPASSLVGNDGAVYIADRGNSVIRRVGTDGVITTWAGDGVAGFRDGARQQARFNSPEKISIDRATGAIYVADTANHRIRKITTDGTVSTVVGTGTAGEAGEGGPANRIQLRSPKGVHVGRDGNLYVADTDNGRILKVNGLP